MATLTLVRRIAASPETVFQALVTPKGLAAWWGPDDGPVLIAESDPRVGGLYRVRFQMLDGIEHEARGEFLELDPPHRIVMSFRWVGAQDDTGESRLEIELHRRGPGTELVFVHMGLRDEEIRKSHEQGWNGTLDKLERLYAKKSQS